MSKIALLLCMGVLAIPSTAIADEWIYERGTDGPGTAVAVSTFANHYPRMDFPYADVKARLIYRCRIKNTFSNTMPGKRFSYDLQFTTAPNLSGDITENGYNTTMVRMKNTYGGRADVMFHQIWGSKTLSTTRPRGGEFGNISAKRIKKYLAGHSPYTAEVNWYGNGAVSFTFDRTWMNASIANANKHCGIEKR